MKRFFVLLMLAVTSMSYAGRLPEELKRVESAGSGYLKIFPAVEKTEGDYQVVQSDDVKKIGGKFQCKTLLYLLRYGFSISKATYPKSEL